MASSVLPAKPGLPPRWAGAARAPPAGDKSQGTAAPWQRGGGPREGDTHTHTGQCFCRAHRKHFLEIPPRAGQGCWHSSWSPAGEAGAGGAALFCPSSGWPSPALPSRPGVGGTALGSFVSPGTKIVTRGRFLILPRGRIRARGRPPRRCHRPYGEAGRPPSLAPVGSATSLSPRWPPGATSHPPPPPVSHLDGETEAAPVGDRGARPPLQGLKRRPSRPL